MVLPPSKYELMTARTPKQFHQSCWCRAFYQLCTTTYVTDDASGCFVFFKRQFSTTNVCTVYYELRLCLTVIVTIKVNYGRYCSNHCHFVTLLHLL